MDVAHDPNVAIIVPRHRRDMNRLTSAPPALIEHSRLDDQIGELDVLYAALKTQSDADAAVRVLDDAGVDDHIANRRRDVAANHHAAGSRPQVAASDDHVLARAIDAPPLRRPPQPRK